MFECLRSALHGGKDRFVLVGHSSHGPGLVLFSFAQDGKLRLLIVQGGRRGFAKAVD